MRTSNKASADHYTWGDACLAWRLVNTPDLTVFEEEMPGDTAETPHFHSRAAQVFYVLEGTLSVVVDGKTIGVEPGSGLHVPAGHRHEVRNNGADTARFLVISSPATARDRVEVPGTRPR